MIPAMVHGDQLLPCICRLACAATAQNMVTLSAKAVSQKWIEEVEHYVPQFFADLDYKDLKTIPRF
ncbi:MAG: hypothetical protein RBR15_12080 [Sphaerochaeta sp.]|nr:hypothetical protein [Sphaerochaeta sp.]